MEEAIEDGNGEGSSEGFVKGFVEWIDEGIEEEVEIEGNDETDGPEVEGFSVNPKIIEKNLSVRLLIKRKINRFCNCLCPVIFCPFEKAISN